MGEVVCGFTVKQCLDFVKNIQQQANDVAEIQALMTTNKYFIFTNALKRIRNALIMLSNVFTNDNTSDDRIDNVFEYNNLKQSQIETIGVKLAPIKDLFDLLGELYNNNEPLFSKRIEIKLHALWKLYIRFKKPSTLKHRLYKHFEDIEDILPIVIELNRTIFGSAQRIKHPIVRKAWMLAGGNQLNDSSLPSNILQDNLYMLLDSEIGEEVANKSATINRFKDGITYIVDDIDNRGTTIGDRNISIAELNDLPQVMFDYLPKDDNDDDYDDKTNKVADKTNKGINRYLCFFCKQICPNNESDTDLEDDESTNNDEKTKDTNSKEYNSTEHFFNEYTKYLQATNDTSFAKNKEILEKKLNILKARQNKNKAEQTNADNIAECIKQVNLLENDKDIQEQTDIENKILKFDNMKKIQLPKYTDPITLSLSAEYIKGNPQITAGIKRPDNKELDSKIDSPERIKADSSKQPSILHNIISSNTSMLHPPCVADYGNEYPCIKIAEAPVEIDETIDTNNYQLTNIFFTIVAHDQNQGATGKVHIRYQINDGKCIKAFTIIRQRKKNKKRKNNIPIDTYKFNINKHEIFKNRKNKSKEDKQMISFWLFCPEEKGWSATVKSINWEQKYSYIGN
jgi:hypothetical protein